MIFCIALLKGYNHNVYNVFINNNMLQDRLLSYTTKYDLSDIHICADYSTAIRVNGTMEILEDVVSKAEVSSFLEEELTKSQLDKFKTAHDLDFAVQFGDIRFRVSALQSNNGLALVLRLIKSEIITLEKLGMPPVISDISNIHSGLVLVTGETGSGKSTTLAAIVNLINEQRNGHILTIEDPIEFLHQPKKCIITQREVGKDTLSFANALKGALRQDPDIILLGEMRDLETISMALTAAETGHLVFGTLHTSGAASTINRILDVFPPAQQGQARSQLAGSLQMTITQQLHKTKDGQGRCASLEIMVANPAIRNLIREDKLQQIESVLQMGMSEGMITMSKSLEQLKNMGKI